MNRLSPLIVRRTGRFAPAAGIAVLDLPGEAEADGGLIDDLKLFAVAWLGGLVFFGTLFG